MGRRTDNQVNLRLSREHYETLEAAVFVHRLGSPSKALSVLAEEFIDKWTEDSSVQAALRARHEADGEATGKVHELPPPRKRAR
jgi:hypothetical protein